MLAASTFRNKRVQKLASSPRSVNYPLKLPQKFPGHISLCYLPDVYATETVKNLKTVQRPPLIFSLGST